MISKVIRDAGKVESLPEVLAPLPGDLGEVAGGLAAGWGMDGERQHALRAVAGHGVPFETWRCLADEVLSEEEDASLVEG